MVRKWHVSNVVPMGQDNSAIPCVPQVIDSSQSSWEKFLYIHIYTTRVLRSNLENMIAMKISNSIKTFPHFHTLKMPRMSN